MLLSLVYFAVRRLLRLITGGSERDDVAREIEILVLRHQLRVLGRNRRAPLRRRDRVLLTAANRLLERDRWRSFPVWSADSAALASRVGAAQVDLPTQTPSGPAQDRRRDPWGANTRSRRDLVLMDESPEMISPPNVRHGVELCDRRNTRGSPEVKSSMRPLAVLVLHVGPQNPIHESVFGLARNTHADRGPAASFSSAHGAWRVV
jgi:hypothetical protein